jgi:tetratricopeptide (TPR) repeat protein
MNVLLVPVLLVPGFAPSPFPSRPESREIEALARAADASFETASRVNQRLLLDAALAPKARADLQRHHRLSLEQAAEQYARLSRLIEALKTSSSARKQQATRAAFKGAKIRFTLGQYEKALTDYERLIEKHHGKVEGLDALGGAVSCHAALGQVNKVQQRLIQINKALNDVPAEIREPWEKWLEEAVRALKAT